MTGRVMGNKNNPELTISLLLCTALFLEGIAIQTTFYLPANKMNWTEARMYCQKNFVDLVTWNTVNGKWLAAQLMEKNATPIWIGLHRDPENDNVWEWIRDAKGADLSQSSYWDSGQQISLCAYVASDQMWYSDLCSNLHGVYCFKGNIIQYNQVNITWDQASQYCGEKNSELVTLSAIDVALPYDGWIGLYQATDNSWSWIGNQSANSSKWAPGEPSNPDCGSFHADSVKWYSNLCYQKLQFVCYTDNLVVVNENKTWEQAMSYCSNLKTSTPCADSTGTCTYRYQLFSPQQSIDYSYLADRVYTATTDEVWIGLRFLGEQWLWMNGQVLDSQVCPSLQNHCATLSKYDTGSWMARDCTERKNFICLLNKTLP